MYRVCGNGRASHQRSNAIQLACAATVLIVTSISFSQAVAGLGVLANDSTSTISQPPTEMIRMAGRPF